MASKLNQRKPATPKTAATVAAARGEAIAISANGNIQFKKDSLQRLYELSVATLYGSGKSQGALGSDAASVEIIKHIGDAVRMGALDFVANLIIHTRSEMNIRTMPIVMTVQFANALRAYNKSYVHMRSLVRDVIQRADQITDLYAYALTVFGDKKKVPTAIKRGVADAFNKFNEYHFAKYNRSGLSFRDVLRIVHPTASSEAQGEILAKIMSDSLATPITWETQLSANGQRDPAERETPSAVWSRLITEGNLPYMAMLRNLRNIAQAGVSAEAHRRVVDTISDPNAVAKSRQLPFDIKQAHDIILHHDTTLAAAVSDALDLSVGNLPQIGNKLWVVCDFSGSMGYAHQETSAFSNALMLLSALTAANRKNRDFAVTLFGSSARTLTNASGNLPKAKGVLELMDQYNKFRAGGISGSTNFRAALDEYSCIGFVPDTIIVLTDGEVDYFPYGVMRDVNKSNAMKIVINMSGAVSTPMSIRDGWHPLAGWSTGLFKWIPAMRESTNVIDQLAQPYVPKQLSTKVDVVKSSSDE